MFKQIKQALGGRYLSTRHFWNYELTDIRNSYLSKSTKPKMTPHGFQLVGSRSIHHVAMQNGTFELEETALFKAQFEQADVFVDVGANIGFYSCLARSLGKHVVTVEPLSSNLEYVYRNMMINDWRDVEVFPLGMSDKPGVATLYGASSTGASLIGNWAGASQLFQRTIPLSSLDIILGNRFAGQKLFIKIDVEGVEYPVLLGAATVMRMNPRPTWVIETCLNEFHPDGTNPHYKDLFHMFWQLGYEARTADGKNNPVLPADVDKWVAAGRCGSGTINYKFSPL